MGEVKKFFLYFQQLLLHCSKRTIKCLLIQEKYIVALDNHDDFSGLLIKKISQQINSIAGDPIQNIDDDIKPSELNERPIKDFIKNFPLSHPNKNALIKL
jgi:hypothetical protein